MQAKELEVELAVLRREAADSIEKLSSALELQEEANRQLLAEKESLDAALGLVAGTPGKVRFGVVRAAGVPQFGRTCKDGNCLAF